MPQYETSLEAAQRRAMESASRVTAQKGWISELERLGYDTAAEKRALAQMQEQVWSAYAEVSRQQGHAQPVERAQMA